MKLAYQYDEAFVPLKDNFLKNIHDEFEFIEKKLEKPKFSQGATQSDQFGGGIDYWIGNTKYLLNIINSCEPNEYFMFSDVDIVFFKPILPTINKLISDNSYDALFSREIPHGEVPWQGGDVPGNINFGFFVMKACDRSRRFLEELLTSIEKNRILNQVIVNKLLYGSPKYNLNWNLLPIEFTTTNFFGPVLPTDFNKDHALVNKNSLTFHAIYPIDPCEKMKLLKLAIDTVNKDENSN